jgi:chromosome segregation ATPase
MTSPTTATTMLSETVEKKRRYAELLAGLDASLPSLAEQVDGLADRMLPGLCPGDQLDWLDVLAGEADARRRDVEALAAAGDELVAVLVELDCRDSPKAREIASEVSRARAGLADVDEAIGQKRKALEALLARLMAANADLAAALDWMDTAEARAATIVGRGPSLDPTTLQAQIAENRAFAADVTGYAPNVSIVVERCASVWIESRVTELQDRHRALAERLDQHDKRLDDVRRRLASVADGIASLDRWIGGAVGAIGRRSMDLEQLVATRLTRKAELDSVTAVARELTADETTIDRHRLRDAVSDLRARWRELTQLIAGAISSQVRTCLQKSKCGH